MADPRWRDLAGPVGVLPTGPGNRITDVPGVLVGHSQAGSGEKSGVTIVAPPALPAPAAVTTVNGVGEPRQLPFFVEAEGDAAIGPFQRYAGIKARQARQQLGRGIADAQNNLDRFLL